MRFLRLNVTEPKDTREQTSEAAMEGLRCKGILLLLLFFAVCFLKMLFYIYLFVCKRWSRDTHEKVQPMVAGSLSTCYLSGIRPSMSGLIVHAFTC